jgi:hypothetical protein
MYSASADYISSALTAVMLFRVLQDFRKYHDISEFLSNANTRSIFDMIGMGLSSYDTTGRVEVLDSEAFYPIAWNEPDGQALRQRIVVQKKALTEAERREKLANSFAVNYWTHTW